MIAAICAVLFPFTSHGQWIRMAGPEGGMINCFAAHENWVAAGVQAFTRGMGSGGGVYFSFDGGATWQDISTNLPAMRIEALAFHRGRIFAGAPEGLFILESPGSNWQVIPELSFSGIVDMDSLGNTLIACGDRYVYLSKDEGDQWAFYGELFNGLFPTSMAVIGTNVFIGTYGNGVFRSSDTCKTWMEVNTGLTDQMINDLAANGQELLAGTSMSGVFLSTDHGANWTPINAGLDDLESYTLAARGDFFLAGSWSGLRISRDHGKFWSKVEDDSLSIPILDIIFLGPRLLVGSPSGVQLSTDDGVSWNKTNAGLDAVSIYSWYQDNQNIMAATFGQGLHLSADNGETWHTAGEGLDARSIFKVDRKGEKLFAATSRGVYRSNDDGATWTAVNVGLPDLWVNCITGNSPWLLAGTDNSILRSNDDGESWTVANDGMQNPHANDLIYFDSAFFAATGHGVYYSINNGDYWHLCTNGIPATYVYRLYTNDSHIYAATGHYLYRSTGRDKEWQQLYTGITDNNIIDIVVNGRDLYAVGIRDGLFFSGDDGSSWRNVDANIFMNFLTSLCINDGFLFAGTGGRGVWRRSLTELSAMNGSRSQILPEQFSLDQNFPNPFNQRTTIRFYLPRQEYVHLSVYTAAGTLTAQLLSKPLHAGVYAVTWDANDCASGIYYCRLQAGDGNQTIKIVLMR